MNKKLLKLLTERDIEDILKALYCEKSEIILRKKIFKSQQQNNDIEYSRNQNLRVLFEDVLK